MDCKGIKPVNPKGNQPWIFIGRTDADAEAEAIILCPPNAKSQIIGKDPDAGKDRRQEEKGATEKETVGWHHRLNGHEFEQTLGDSEGQGRLGMLQSTGLRGVWHNWVTEPQQNMVKTQWMLAALLMVKIYWQFIVWNTTYMPCGQDPI